MATPTVMCKVGAATRIRSSTVSLVSNSGNCNITPFRNNGSASKVTPATIKNNYAHLKQSIESQLSGIKVPTVDLGKYSHAFFNIFKPESKTISELQNNSATKREKNEEQKDENLLLKKKAMFTRESIRLKSLQSHPEQYTFEQAMTQQNESIQDHLGVQKILDTSSETGSAIVIPPDSLHSDQERSEISPLESISKTANQLLPKISNISAKNLPTSSPNTLISKAIINSRTRALVESLQRATSAPSQLIRMEELCKHLIQYPDARSTAAKIRAIPCVLKIGARGQRSDTGLQSQARQTLALLGYVGPPKGRGIRVLTIDGGGTRGLVAVETLKLLERMCDRSLHTMFDYVCGVSTGALVAAMFAVFKVPVDEIEELYKKCSSDMFSRNRVLGTSKLFTSHAYYDSNLWANILRDNMGDKSFVDSMEEDNGCKFSAVSSLMNTSSLKNFLFRNYNLPPGVQSHYPGSCRYALWEAIKASSAAPGYYEECKIDGHVHQDGGLLMNNPTAIALHEVKLLWPNQPIQCVISLGNGRFEPTAGQTAVNYTSLKNKIIRLVDSATDTEAVHTVLHDLLPPSTYFRFNPYLSETYTLDEIRPEKWEQMQLNAQMYLRKNELKLRRAIVQLEHGRHKYQKAMDWAKFQKDVYT